MISIDVGEDGLIAACDYCDVIKDKENILGVPKKVIFRNFQIL